MPILYNNEHLYIEVKNGDTHTAVIGISDYAQKVLGDIVFVDLPQTDVGYVKNDTIAVLESSKAALDISAPISGKVISINTQLLDTPSLLNSLEQDDRWLCVISIENEEELECLLTQKEYDKIIAKL